MTFGQFNIAQCFCTVIMECILELHTITCLYTFTCFITFTPFDLPTSVAKAPAPGCYLPCYLFSFLLVCWQIRGISVMRGRFDQISLFCSELNSRFLAQELIKKFQIISGWKPLAGWIWCKLGLHSWPHGDCLWHLKHQWRKHVGARSPFSVVGQQLDCPSGVWLTSGVPWLLHCTSIFVWQCERLLCASASSPSKDLVTPRFIGLLPTLTGTANSRRGTN